MFLQRMAVFTLTAALLALVGCESKFNRHNFQMIQPGVDDQQDVRHILGKPESVMGDVWFYDDFRHHHSAQIYFDGEGRVVSKEWMDAKTGDWEGQDPWLDEPAEGEVRESTTRTRRIHDD